MELKLSAAFEPADKKAGVECTAVMLNINLGHNREIMEKCKTLKEYSIFVAEVRKGTADGYPLKEAIERAVDRCIEENILKDILTKNRAEVTNMVLTEYDEERHIANEKKISLEEGLRIGREEGLRVGRDEGLKAGEQRMNELYRCMLADKRYADLERAASDTDYREQLFKEYGI